MTAQHPAAPETGVWPKGRLVDHPQPGKVWVQIPHRNDIGSDWIEVDTTPAAPETETDANGWVADLLATHGHMPCSQTTPTVSAWWAQCYGCDWKGPHRSHSSARDADHRSHVAEIIATAARERVRVVEGERDAARGDLVFSRQTTTNVMEALADSGAETLAAIARAESAEAAHADVSADYDSRGERLWRLAVKAGHVPHESDNDATAELVIADALAAHEAEKAAHERLRAEVEGRVAQYSRLAGQAMDPECRDWLTAFVGTLTTLLGGGEAR